MAIIPIVETLRVESEISGPPASNRVWALRQQWRHSILLWKPSVVPLVCSRLPGMIGIQSASSARPHQPLENDFADFSSIAGHQDELTASAAGQTDIERLAPVLQGEGPRDRYKET